MGTDLFRIFFGGAAGAKQVGLQRITSAKEKPPKTYKGIYTPNVKTL